MTSLVVHRHRPTLLPLKLSSFLPSTREREFQVEGACVKYPLLGANVLWTFGSCPMFLVPKEAHTYKLHFATIIQCPSHVSYMFCDPRDVGIPLSGRQPSQSCSLLIGF